MNVVLQVKITYCQEYKDKIQGRTVKRNGSKEVLENITMPEEVFEDPISRRNRASLLVLKFEQKKDVKILSVEKVRECKRD